jgi:ATP-dependent Clp protease protease subunit
MAASMGAVLLCAEQQENVHLPHSRVMIHQPSAEHKELLRYGNQLARNVETERRVVHYLAPFWTNFDKVHKDSERDYWMKADEAKEYGMIDEVEEDKNSRSQKSKVKSLCLDFD